MFGALRRVVGGRPEPESSTSSSSDEMAAAQGPPQEMGPPADDRAGNGGNGGGADDGGSGAGHGGNGAGAGNDALVSASSASAAPASSAESQLAQSDAARRARQEIAQSVKAGMSSFETGALMFTREEFCRFTCHPSAAPSWFQQRYNTTENFTWAFCGFDPVVSSFYPSGSRNHQDLVSVCARFSVKSLINLSLHISLAGVPSCAARLGLKHDSSQLFVHWRMRMMHLRHGLAGCLGGG